MGDPHSKNNRHRPAPIPSVGVLAHPFHLLSTYTTSHIETRKKSERKYSSLTLQRSYRYHPYESRISVRRFSLLLITAQGITSVPSFLCSMVDFMLKIVTMHQVEASQGQGPCKNRNTRIIIVIFSNYRFLVHR